MLSTKTDRGHDQERNPGADELVQPAAALLLEENVPHAQRLVDDEDVRLDRNRDGKGHRIIMPVEYVLTGCSMNADVGKLPIAANLASISGREIRGSNPRVDILAPRELRVEARP